MVVGPEWTRRAFLERLPVWSSLGLGAGPLCGELPAAPRNERTQVDPPIPIVDTHVHLWDLAAVNVPWVKTSGWEILNRNYLTDDFKDATHGLHVVLGVYMEVYADPADLDKEAEYVINLCKRGDTPIKAAVIGGRPESPGFRAYITKYAGNPYVKGVRRVLHNDDMPRGACLEPQFVDSIKGLGELNLSFDLCTRPSEILDGVKLIDQCPKTRFVIDHCGNIDVSSTNRRLRQAWEQGMREAAKRNHVVCKISGIVRTATKDTWKPRDLAPVVDFCLDTFGSNRVMFGGDWPAIHIRATYRQWTEALQEIVRRRSLDFRRKLFHDNAVKFFGLRV